MINAVATYEYARKVGVDASVHDPQHGTELT